MDRQRGEALGEFGMRLVESNQSTEWKELAKRMILEYIADKGPCVIEDARQYCAVCNLPDPTHPNAWGAIVSGLAKSNLIERTGEWVKASSVLSHASMYPIWRIK